MANFRVVIPAAGRGRRAGLPYPKTLYPVDGIPILHRLLAVFSNYDASPTVIVSPQGKDLIANSLQDASLSAHLVVQPQSYGMGDAVLRFSSSPASYDAKNLLLAWGDIAYLQESTISQLASTHLSCANDFTFVTKYVENAYTLVHRDLHGSVVSVEETRERKMTTANPGERDIGLFALRKDIVFDILNQDLDGKYGAFTGEHGFLYVVNHLVRLGAKVSALPIASDLDLISLNYISDLI